MSRVVEVVERYIVPDFPKIELPTEDGIPLETNWHRLQINLLVDCVRQHWRGRADFFVGGNMFIYYSMQQVRNKEYKGPDVFVVKGVDGARDRPAWIVWEEDGRLPDIIVELLSPSTAAEDLGSKKELYERRFKTPEYFCYDPDTHTLQGWQLEKQGYLPLKPDERGHLHSEQLDAWLGLWEGGYQGVQAMWVRLFAADGSLVPTGEEAERLRAEAERRRAEAAEAEVARLRDEVKRLADKAD